MAKRVTTTKDVKSTTTGKRAQSLTPEALAKAQAQSKANYEKMYKDAKSKGKAKQVTHEFYNWEEEGQVLIGKLIGYDQVESKEYDGVYNRYVFDTDSGLVGVICGKLIDAVMDEGDFIGKVLAIEYQGKRQLEGGRQVNRFRMEVIE